jgi:hypothetical protein
MRDDLILAEGDYGQDANGVWHARPPGNHTGSLADHEVVDHEDETISVTPSILVDVAGIQTWHGQLTRGEWVES